MLSLIEFAVYGLFAYSSILMLIISVIKKDIPDEKDHAVTRVIWLIPGIIASFILAQSVPDIIIENGYTITTAIINGTTGDAITNSTETIPQRVVTLQNFGWTSFHMMIGFVLIFYTILQMITLLTKIK